MEAGSAARLQRAASQNTARQQGWPTICKPASSGMPASCTASLQSSFSAAHQRAQAADDANLLGAVAQAAEEEVEEGEEAGQGGEVQQVPGLRGE